MGWLKKLFSKSNNQSKKQQAEVIEENELNEFLKDLLTTEEPRAHHYSFAQEAIPSFAHGDTDKFFTDCGRSPEEYIAYIWQQVCANYDDEGSSELEASDFSLEETELEGSRAVLIRMPTPIAPIESYAVVVIEDKRSGDIRARCITFEKGDNENECFICEITNDGTRLNFGATYLTGLTNKDFFSAAYTTVFHQLHSVPVILFV